MPRTPYAKMWKFGKSGCIQGTKFSLAGGRTSWGGTGQEGRARGELRRDRVRYRGHPAACGEWTRPSETKDTERPDRKYTWYPGQEWGGGAEVDEANLVADELSGERPPRLT